MQILSSFSIFFPHKCKSHVPTFPNNSLCVKIKMSLYGEKSMEVFIQQNQWNVVIHNIHFNFRLTKERWRWSSFNLSLSLTQLLSAHMTRHVISSTTTPTTPSEALFYKPTVHKWSTQHNYISVRTYAAKHSVFKQLHRSTVNRKLMHWGLYLLAGGVIMVGYRGTNP